MLMQTLVLLGKPLAGQVWLFGFLFGATVCGYQFFRRAPWQRALVYLAGAGALVCLWHLPVQTLGMLAPPALVWVLYYFAGDKSLRRARLLKPLSIAFVWAWVTVWLPLDVAQWPKAAPIFLGRAAFIFALALAYDFTDLHYDRRYQLSTLVRHLGEKKTFQWIDRSLLAAALVCIVNFFYEIYGVWAMSALIGSLGFSAWALRFIQRGLKQPYWQKFWIDALMVVQFLWVLAGEMLAG
jgi:4-hydroxybenzoate polyprenyltransferase